MSRTSITGSIVTLPAVSAPPSALQDVEDSLSVPDLTRIQTDDTLGSLIDVRRLELDDDIQSKATPSSSVGTAKPPTRQHRPRYLSNVSRTSHVSQEIDVSPPGSIPSSSHRRTATTPFGNLILGINAQDKRSKQMGGLSNRRHYSSFNVNMGDMKYRLNFSASSPQHTKKSLTESGRKRKLVRSLIADKFQESSHVRVEHTRLHHSNVRFHESQFWEQWLFQTFIVIGIIAVYIRCGSKGLKNIEYHFTQPSVYVQLFEQAIVCFYLICYFTGK